MLLCLVGGSECSAGFGFVVLGFGLMFGWILGWWFWVVDGLVGLSVCRCFVVCWVWCFGWVGRWFLLFVVGWFSLVWFGLLVVCL